MLERHGVDELVSTPVLSPRVRRECAASLDDPGSQSHRVRPAFARRTDLTMEEVSSLLASTDGGSMGDQSTLMSLASNPTLVPEASKQVLTRLLHLRRRAQRLISAQAHGALKSFALNHAFPDGFVDSELDDPESALLDVLLHHPLLTCDQMHFLAARRCAASLLENTGICEHLQEELLSAGLDEGQRQLLAQNPALLPAFQHTLLALDLCEMLVTNPSVDPLLLSEVAATPELECDVWWHPALPLTESMDVSRLPRHRRDDLLDMAEARGLHLETFDLLLKDWSATIDELFVATAALSPAAPS